VVDAVEGEGGGDGFLPQARSVRQTDALTRTAIGRMAGVLAQAVRVVTRIATAPP
jgi:hypothetical protein